PAGATWQRKYPSAQFPPARPTPEIIPGKAGDELTSSYGGRRRGFLQDVAEPATRVDQRRLTDDRQFLTQAADRGIHHVAHRIHLPVIDVLFDFRSRDDLPAAMRQIFQEEIFAGREIDRL